MQQALRTSHHEAPHSPPSQQLITFGLICNSFHFACFVNSSLRFLIPNLHPICTCSCLFTPLTEGRSARDLTQAATSKKKKALQVSKTLHRETLLSVLAVCYSSRSISLSPPVQSAVPTARSSGGAQGLWPIETHWGPEAPHAQGQ